MKRILGVLAASIVLSGSAVMASATGAQASGYTQQVRLFDTHTQCTTYQRLLRQDPKAVIINGCGVAGRSIAWHQYT